MRTAVFVITAGKRFKNTPRNRARHCWRNSIRQSDVGQGCQRSCIGHLLVFGLWRTKVSWWTSLLCWLDGQGGVCGQVLSPIRNLSRCTNDSLLAFCLIRISPSKIVQSSWNVMAHGGALEGKWRGNWRMEWVDSTLHTTSEHGVSSIITADAHTSAASSRLNWRPRRFKWTRPFPRKTKSGFCAFFLLNYLLAIRSFGFTQSLI